MDVVCLLGNGASVAYNPELAIGPLTMGIIDAFVELGGTDPGDALAAFAERLNGAGLGEREGFEGLLGPLDTISQAIPILAGVHGAFAGIDWVADPLDQAGDAFRRLHRLGLATALGLIAERAEGLGDGARHAGFGRLVDELLETVGEDRLTVATLSYDGLLLSVLPDEQMADLASGFGEDMRLIGGRRAMTWPLRDHDDLPAGRRIHVLHLHGSLGWLRFEDGPRKVQIGDLREVEYWRLLAADEEVPPPVVVLTDRKRDVPVTEPFSLAYEILGRRLVASSRWCIAGYSMLDEPVNDALRAALELRREFELGDPRLLVIGRAPHNQLRQRLEGAIGALPEATFLADAGLPDAVAGPEWQGWAAP